MKSNDIVSPKNVDEETAIPNNKEYKSAKRVDFYRQRSRRRNRSWKLTQRIIEGTIRKGLGKPWDTVYSELRSKLNLEYNNYKQVWWAINKDVEVVDGVPYLPNRNYELSPGNYYVDSDGIVRVTPERSKIFVRKNNKYEVKKDGKTYWRILSIWYEVEVCTKNRGWVYNNNYKNYCFFSAHGFTRPELEVATTWEKEYIAKMVPDGNYGEIYVHTHKKRQLKTKEIRDLGLHLFTIDE